MTIRLILSVFLALPVLFAQVGPALSGTGTPLPAYRAFFYQVQYLQATAQTAAPADAAVLQNWHQTHIGLTDQEAALLKQVAAAHFSAIDAIDKQAAQIIQTERAQFPGGQLPSHGALPAPSQQLTQLQQQRDSATLTYIQMLQGGMSAASFSKVDAWIKANFSQQIKKPAPPSARPAVTAQTGVNQ